MKITSVDVAPLRYTLPQAKWDAHLQIPFRDCLVVIVTTDEGMQGAGEAAVFGGAAAAVASVVMKQLAPLLIGRNPLLVAGVWRLMYDSTAHLGRAGIAMAAISGVDIALWDIVGKCAGMPVYQLLGASVDVLEAYASGGLYGADLSPAAVAEEVRGYAERGFRSAKVKVAGLDLESDYARVAAVRDAVGAGFGIMVDANCGYQVHDAIRFANRIAGLGVKWLEEPVRADDIEGSVRVARNSPVLIAGYESQSSRFVFRELIACGAVDIVQADAIWAGGVSNVKKIADLADSWHRTFTPHVYTSAIGLAANMHLLASCTNGGPLEMDGTPNPLRDEIVTQPIAADEIGHVAMPQLPGIGVVLDPDALGRYRLEL
jgi:L-alanine-DL-glutamate epimerase-like enolase superfamily enzyme